MGNANNKMSRSCVPGANNNNNNKAQTGTMDERIDALVLRLHEVSFPFFSSSFSFSFERVRARRRSPFLFPHKKRESLKKCKQKSLSLSLSFCVFFFYFTLFVSKFCCSSARGFRQSKKEKKEKERRAGEREREREREREGFPMGHRCLCCLGFSFAKLLT